jgi:Flp pilus assembly protein TadD
MTPASSTPSGENLFTMMQLGHTQILSGNYEQATRVLERILDADPRNSWAYYLIGLAYYHQRLFEQAISAFSKAVEINPKNWSAYAGRGLVYMLTGNTEKAGFDFFPDHIDETDPDLYRAFYTALCNVHREDSGALNE